jgi:hypothetical protein
VGRRSRKRPGAGAEPPPPPAPGGAPPPGAPRRRTPRARLDELPRPPWHPVPLSELCILAGLVALAVGWFGADGDRRRTLLGLGIVLVGLGSLEVALREHLAGFRSHSALLSFAAALAITVPVALATGMARWLAAVVLLVLFAAGFVALRALFRRRSGGLGFRA